jgi:hypothetical protein
MGRRLWPMPFLLFGIANKKAPEPFGVRGKIKRGPALAGFLLLLFLSGSFFGGCFLGRYLLGCVLHRLVSP